MIVGFGLVVACLDLYKNGGCDCGSGRGRRV